MDVHMDVHVWLGAISSMCSTLIGAQLGMKRLE
jgi:hypothetical protein